MKKLSIALLFTLCFTSLFSQNAEITLDSDKFNSYLEFINDAMNGVSTNDAIFRAKNILQSFGDKKGELIIMDDGKNYIKTNEGTYLHVIKNKSWFSLGIKGIGRYSTYIYIYSSDKDFDKDFNVLGINTRILFRRSSATDTKLQEIQKLSTNSIHQFFINKCTLGIDRVNLIDGATRMGNRFNSMWSFDIIGKNMVIGDKEENSSCINSCETCMIEAEIAHTKNDYGESKYYDFYSHTFWLGFSNKLLLAAYETGREIDDFLYEANFIISDYKDKGYEENNENSKLDLRKINNYDLKAMINFFIEDYNRYSKKVNEKFISPKIFDEKNILATFETLQGNTIALSYGMDNDSKIIIKVDPEKWANASEVKRWYILYHELGHDILNLKHGEGGKMMFNFAEKEYSWDDFITDKKYMLSRN